MWTACSVAGTAMPLPAEIGKSFSLNVGESARTADDALRVGIDDVTTDSRCPKGERCVWAGDAIVRVWLQRAPGPRQTRDLHSAPGDAQAVRLLGYELRLVRLDPYPVTGRPITKSDYVATLMLSRSSPAEADR